MTTLNRRLRVASCVLATVCGAVSHVRAAQDAGILTSWQDGETRRSYAPAKNETEAFFALVPACSHGTPTLTFATTFPGKEPTQPPTTFDVRAAVGTRVNPHLLRKLALTFAVNPSGRDATTVDVSPRLRPTSSTQLPGGTIDSANGTMTGAEFETILNAKTLSANVLGMECALTTAQLDALRGFAKTLLIEPPPSVAAFGVSTPGSATTTILTPAAATIPAVNPTVEPPPPVVTLLRPENNDGLWVRFHDQKWVNSGPAVPFDTSAFVRVGDYVGFPVFKKRDAVEDVIYLPTRAGLIVPYRRKA